MYGPIVHGQIHPIYSTFTNDLGRSGHDLIFTISEQNIPILMTRIIPYRINFTVPLEEVEVERLVANSRQYCHLAVLFQVKNQHNLYKNTTNHDFCCTLNNGTTLGMTRHA